MHFILIIGLHEKLWAFFADANLSCVNNNFWVELLKYKVATESKQNLTLFWYVSNEEDVLIATFVSLTHLTENLWITMRMVWLSKRTTNIRKTKISNKIRTIFACFMRQISEPLRHHYGCWGWLLWSNSVCVVVIFMHVFIFPFKKFFWLTYFMFFLFPSNRKSLANTLFIGRILKNLEMSLKVEGTKDIIF